MRSLTATTLAIRLWFDSQQPPKLLVLHGGCGVTDSTVYANK